MALNLATITNDYKTALVAGGADPANPFTLALAQGLATTLISALTAATVSPAGAPTPMQVVAPGFGTFPVSGTGKVL